jgi:hypothetical protein
VYMSFHITFLVVSGLYLALLFVVGLAS